MNNTSPQVIRQAALRLLARRDYSSQELKQKLKARSFCNEQIAAVLQKLTDDGYLSDLRAAEAIFRCCIAKGLGPKRIQLEMQLKGIEKDVVESVFTENTGVDWLQLAHDMLRKKFKQESIQAGLVMEAKKYRYLTQRGFDYDVIQEALKNGAGEVS